MSSLATVLTLLTLAATAAPSPLEFDCRRHGGALASQPPSTATVDEDVTQIVWTGCDLTDVDFGFLAAYPNVEYVWVAAGCRLVEFAGMARLERLQRVRVEASDFRRFDGAATPHLNWVDLLHVADDDVLDGLIASLAPYEDVVQRILVTESNVTRIPAGLAGFGRLDEFHFTYNRLTTTLATASFPAAFAARTIDLRRCAIDTIEAGAFQGDYGGRTIDLFDSRLPRLDEAVFGPVLRSMHSAANGGRVKFSGVGPCDCGLAWLNRDSPHLLEYVEDAECLLSDGWTYVQALDASVFNNCPAKAA